MINMVVQAQEPTHGPNQPYASYWFVDELLQWNPSEDPHAGFNISHVPLSPRFIDSTTQIISSLSNEPAVMGLFSVHPTSGHPSQGFQSVEHYAFPFWQYLDYFVQWGGSAGEGTIVPPAATWTDAAHRNGVEAYGTVFFPPNVYGGKEQWLRDFLVKDDNGDFPAAEKLIEVATFYQFDGWFINQETHGFGEQEAQLMQKFFEFYREQSKGRLKIIWYDAMIEDGRVIWQDELNAHNAPYFQHGESRRSDKLFIDFGWSITDLEDSREMAVKMGRSPWDLFAGIDIQSNAYKTLTNWEALYENDIPYTTSIGLYQPNSTFNMAKTKQPEDVYKHEQELWNGGFTQNDHVGRPMEWKGFSKHFPARSMIQKAPFTTNFNYGLGRSYFSNGKRVSINPWHNMSLQDILPSWQFLVDTSQVMIEFDFSDSYEGGNCLSFDLHGTATIPLYKMNIVTELGYELAMVSKNQGATAEVILEFDNGRQLVLPIEQTTEWNTQTISLDDFKGLKIIRLSLSVKGEGGLKLGQLSIRPITSKFTHPVKARATRYHETSEVQVTLEKLDGVVRYDIYQLDNDGKETWLGATTSDHYYLPKVSRNVKNLTIYAVGADGRKGKQSIIKIK